MSHLHRGSALWQQGLTTDLSSRCEISNPVSCSHIKTSHTPERRVDGCNCRTFRACRKVISADFPSTLLPGPSRPLRGLITRVRMSLASPCLTLPCIQSRAASTRALCRGSPAPALTSASEHEWTTACQSLQHKHAAMGLCEARSRLTQHRRTACKWPANKVNLSVCPVIA